MYEAFSRGDAQTALTYFDPQVVIDATHRVDGRIGQGREEMSAILTEWLGAWDDWREEIEEVRDLDSQVLLVTNQRGRGRGSGVDWEHRFWMLFEIQAGRITRWTIYDDAQEALEAAGLSE